jgi:hypothetical protein
MARAPNKPRYVKGYSSLRVDIAFDANGKFLHFGIWE